MRSLKVQAQGLEQGSFTRHMDFPVRPRLTKVRELMNILKFYLKNDRLLCTYFFSPPPREGIFSFH